MSGLSLGVLAGQATFTPPTPILIFFGTGGSNYRIDNYNADYTYTVTTSIGTGSNDGDLIMISGVGNGQSVTVTVTATYQGVTSPASSTTFTFYGTAPR